VTDDEINAEVERIMALPDELETLTIAALVESLPPQRQYVVREIMRSMLESD
jgi:hypothetical protein